MKEFIKRKAKEQGISLQDIANKLELKSYPSFLRTIDTGDNLKLKQLRIIAQMLNCSMDELTGEMHNKKPHKVFIDGIEYIPKEKDAE